MLSGKSMQMKNPAFVLEEKIHYLAENPPLCTCPLTDYINGDKQCMYHLTLLASPRVIKPTESRYH